MYVKNRIPGYVVVTRALEKPTVAYAYETWVTSTLRENDQHVEPTIIRYATEPEAVDGHIAAIARFMPA